MNTGNYSNLDSSRKNIAHRLGIKNRLILEVFQNDLMKVGLSIGCKRVN